MAEIQLIVVTPEATALEAAADFVAVPLYDGELGVLPGRAPMIGRLGFGELRFMSSGRTERYYIDGGFVQIASNVVSVLTNRSIPAASIDGRAVAEHLAEVRARKANTDELFETRDKAELQARAQLRVANRAS